MGVVSFFFGKYDYLIVAPIQIFIETKKKRTNDFVWWTFDDWNNHFYYVIINWSSPFYFSFFLNECEKKRDGLKSYF